MALGFSATAPAKHLPILKYNARDGRFVRIDRGPDGVRSEDVTENFAAVVDMDAIEVGWMLFGHGIRPDMRLFPLGGAWPDAPGPQHKRGIKLVLQLGRAAGGDLRELCSTSGQFLAGFDALHDEFLAARNDNPGKLPVIVLVATEPDQPPSFTIAGWVDRPEALAAA